MIELVGYLQNCQPGARDYLAPGTGDANCGATWTPPQLRDPGEQRRAMVAWWCERFGEPALSFVCTLDAGHRGVHAAHDLRDVMVATWGSRSQVVQRDLLLRLRRKKAHRIELAVAGLPMMNPKPAFAAWSRWQDFEVDSRKLCDERLQLIGFDLGAEASQ